MQRHTQDLKETSSSSRNTSGQTDRDWERRLWGHQRLCGHFLSFDGDRAALGPLHHHRRRCRRLFLILLLGIIIILIKRVQACCFWATGHNHANNTETVLHHTHTQPITPDSTRLSQSRGSIHMTCHTPPEPALTDRALVSDAQLTELVQINTHHNTITWCLFINACWLWASGSRAPDLTHENN